MDHLEASSLLTGFVGGELEASERRALRRHLTECEECQVWVATSELLEALSPDQALTEQHHPSSDELASFALAPETLDDLARRRLEGHVDGCSQCRHEAGLVSASVREARDELAAEPSMSGSLVGSLAAAAARAYQAPLRLAAAVILVVAAAWVGFASSRTPDELTLSNRVFSGEQTVSAGTSMVVGATEVSSGANVVLRSGQLIAIGDGFSVGPGATLTVSTKGRIDDDSSS